MLLVCPLIALAKDQVDYALARNIDAEMFNSEVQVHLLQPLCNPDALSLMSSAATPHFLGLQHCQLPLHLYATSDANAMQAC